MSLPDSFTGSGKSKKKSSFRRTLPLGLGKRRVKLDDCLLEKLINYLTMGRKSAKGKEKKMKRKEEQARIAAAKVVVDAANKLDDPMQGLAPFKKYERKDLNLTIECKKVTDLEKDVTDWVFSLVKSNMQALYEDNDWGWKEREKKEELLDEQARYVIARTADGQLVGFCHFRFDLDFEDEVIYCYEIQLTPEVRRQGLGKFLMQILELLAFRTEMKKVMVTVFKNNDVATNFFTKVLKRPSECKHFTAEDLFSFK